LFLNFRDGITLREPGAPDAGLGIRMAGACLEWVCRRVVPDHSMAEHHGQGNGLAQQDVDWKQTQLQHVMLL